MRMHKCVDIHSPNRRAALPQQAQGLIFKISNLNDYPPHEQVVSAAVNAPRKITTKASASDLVTETDKLSEEAVLGVSA
jgi:hypothetical protein